MRFTFTLVFLAVTALYAVAPVRAQNVEVSGWRPSDWRLVQDPRSSMDSSPSPASAGAAADRTPPGSWVRWGVDDSAAAVASLDGRVELRATSQGLPQGCALGSDGSAHIRAFSAECVAAAALARSRESEARAALEWSAGPVALTASFGFGTSVGSLSDSLNPLGSLPVWLLDNTIPVDRALGVGGISTRSRDVSVRGDWKVSSGVTVHVLGSRGELVATASSSAELPVRVEAEQTVLGFGITHGSLSGSVTGRRVAPVSPLRAEESVTAFDLGVSWRTPWQGELTVGAREISRGAPPLAEPAQAAKAREDRTPYVQYRQDL